MPFFRITLLRSSIGLPKKTSGVLQALGLRKRMATVFHPVSPQVAGQIMAVKELVAVSEVEKALTKEELRAARRPDPGFYVERMGPEREDDLEILRPRKVHQARRPKAGSLDIATWVTDPAKRSLRPSMKKRRLRKFTLGSALGSNVDYMGASMRGTWQDAKDEFAPALGSP
ncbi:MAG: hypothetical protein Q9174_001155 [Haloplaca sp. 1 TL-2023]